MFSDSSEDTDSSLAAALTKNLSLFRWESHTVSLMWLPEKQSWFHVFLNMIDECWRSTSPQVPQVSESGQQRPADGCTEHVHHRKCFSRRGRAFKSWCSGKVFSLNLFTVTGELTDVVVGYCISPAQSCQELIDDCLVSLFLSRAVSKKSWNTFNLKRQLMPPSPAWDRKCTLPPHLQQYTLFTEALFR